MDAALLKRARAAIASGRLPRNTNASTWGGYASGSNVCALCETPIAVGEVEMELAFTAEDAIPTIALHLPCFDAWRAAANAAS